MIFLAHHREKQHSTTLLLVHKAIDTIDILLNQESQKFEYYKPRDPGRSRGV